MGVGKRIRALRKARGLNQGELAGKIGIKQPSLSDIESGATKELMAETLLKIAAALETNPLWLQTGKGSPVLPSDMTPDESEALSIYRGLPEPHRSAWMASGRAMLASAPPSKSRPYSKVN